jgi:hypothetical protein
LRRFGGKSGAVVQGEGEPIRAAFGLGLVAVGFACCEEKP